MCGKAGRILQSMFSLRMKIAELSLGGQSVGTMKISLKGEQAYAN